MRTEAILAAGLMATSALAAPRRTVRTNPAMRVNRNNSTVVDSADDDVYSTNWSGSVIGNPSGTAFDSVTGTFNVPSVSNPNDGSSGPWVTAAWVGIDGATNQNAILQAGCNFNTDGNTQSNSCWVEWFPNAQVNIDGFNVNEGDSVTVTCASTSSTSGTVTMTDNTTGQTTQIPISAPNSNAALTGQTAEWIVEDISINGGLAPFAAFSPVSFTGCTADASGQAQGAGGNVWLLENSSGTVITSVNIPDGSDVDVSYTG